MNINRTPTVRVGQIYLHEGLNEYLIVTKNNRGEVYFEGNGFRGHAEDVSFIERFPAVDPADVDDVEIEYLLTMCPPGTEATVGFVEE